MDLENVRGHVAYLHGDGESARVVLTQKYEDPTSLIWVNHAAEIQMS